MLFRGKSTQQAAGHVDTASLSWERRGARQQSLRLVVSSWQCNTQPLLEGRRGGRVDVSMEGRARLASHSGVAVDATIEVTDNPDTPRVLGHGWKYVPPSIEGYGQLSTENIDEPRLDLTLYCAPDFIDHVMQTIIAGFSVADGTVVVDLTIGYPDEIPPDFWSEQWQTATLQVHQWTVRASARKPK